MSTYGNALYGRNPYGPYPANPNGTSPGVLTWLVQVSWDGSDNFGSTIEPPMIRAISWLRGRDRLVDAGPDGPLAQPADEQVSITVRDPAARYDPGNSGSPLFASLGRPALPMRVLLLNGSDPGEAQVVFSGCLTHTQYDARSGIAALHGQGMAGLLSTQIYAPSQPYSANAWDAAFKADGSTPVPINYWEGQSGGLGLAHSARLVLNLAGSAQSILTNEPVLEAPHPRFLPLSGQSAWRALCQVAGAFMARVFFLRDGSLFLMHPEDADGLHPSLDLPAAALLEPGVRRTPIAESLRNQVKAAVNALSAPAFTSPLLSGSYGLCWSAQGPIAVPPNQQLLLDVRFEDSLGRVFAANLLAANSDTTSDLSPWHANSQPDGAGINMSNNSGNGETSFNLVGQTVGSNSLGTIYTQYGGRQDGCRVRLRNFSATRTAYFFNLRVMGAGLSRVSQQFAPQVQAGDEASIAANGSRPIELSNLFIQSAAQARAAAHAALYLLASRDRASIASLTFSLSGTSLYNALLLYEPGCHLQMPENGAGSLSGRQLLVGQRIHWSDASGQNARLELLMHKARPHTAAIAAVSHAAAAAQTQLQWQHTTPIPGRVLVMASCVGSSFSAVSCGGSALTRLSYAGSGASGQPRVEIWSGSNAAAGNGTVLLTLTSAANAQAAALTITGAHPSSPFTALASATSNSGDISLQASAAEYNLLIGAACGEGAPVLSAGIDLWQASADGAWYANGAYRAGNAGSTSLAWQGALANIAAAGVLVLPDPTL